VSNADARIALASRRGAGIVQPGAKLPEHSDRPRRRPSRARGRRRRCRSRRRGRRPEWRLGTSVAL